MNWRFWRRGPSKELSEAREAHQEVVRQRAEVEQVATSLRKGVREPNGLAPLIERAIRSTR